MQRPGVVFFFSYLSVEFRLLLFATMHAINLVFNQFSMFYVRDYLAIRF